MHITHVNFQNFRNFEKLELDFAPGLIILSGKNGAGKTNFLEGLFFGSLLRRFPTSDLSQLFRSREDFFLLKLALAGGEETNLEVFCQKKEERTSLQLKIDGHIVARPQFVRASAAVSFLPEDLNLLTHSPSHRRRFLDETLSTISIDYRHALSLYEKALKQRNLALEQSSDMEVWDEQLARYGSFIIKNRSEFSDYINDELAKVLAGISSELSAPKFSYNAGGDAEKAGFFAQLSASRNRDLEKLNTLVGPHRDDFNVFTDGQQVVGYLSRGQLRAITLALKILQKGYLEKHRRLPIMLFDDVFSEFDEIHQTKLLEFLKTFEQVFLTTAHAQEILKYLPGETQIYNVENGHVQQA